MRALRYVLGALLAAAACWVNFEIQNWELVRMYVVSPAVAFALKLAVLSLLLLAAGCCFGGGFVRAGLSAKAAGAVFVVVLLLQLFFSLGGMVVTSDAQWLVRAMVIFANADLFTYLAAFLTGLCLGSRRA